MFNSGDRATGSQAIVVKMDVTKGTPAVYDLLCLKGLSIDTGIKSTDFVDLCSNGQSISQVVGLAYSFSGEFVVRKDSAGHNLIKATNMTDISNLNDIPVQITDKFAGEIIEFKAAITKASVEYPADDMITCSLEFKPAEAITVTPII